MSVTAELPMIQPRIALHTLVFAPACLTSGQIEPVVQSQYPGSLLTHMEQIEDAIEQVRTSIFDLLILSIDPADAEHLDLIRMLNRLDASMPTVLIVGGEGETTLHDACPNLNSTWELIPEESLTATVLDVRIRKAIDNYQRRWELNHLQHAFQSSLIQYRNLFDEVPDLIFLCDRSGCLLDVNASAVRMFGIRKEKLLMRPLFETLGLSNGDFDRLVECAMADRVPLQDLEVVFQLEGHEPIYGLAHLIRWQHGPGRPVQFQGVVKDISPHKRLERQLRHSESRYKTLYDLARISASSLHLPEVIERSLIRIHECCLSVSTLLLMNQRYDELNWVDGIALTDELKTQFLEQTPLLRGQGFLGRLSLKGGLHLIENPAQTLNHPVVRDWAASHPECILVASAMGRSNPTLPTTLLLMLIPQTVVRKGDEELYEGLSRTLEMGLTNCFHYANSQVAEARYRDLWDHAPAFFISLLKGGTIVEINNTAIEALGFRLGDLIGKPFQGLVHRDDLSHFEEHHATLMETGLAQDYELRLMTHTGEPLYVSFKSEPMLDDHGKRTGEKGILYDITRDKAMEARLRDYAENLERMVEERTIELTQTMDFLNGILEGSTEYAIVGLDAEGRLLHFNRGAQLLFAYDADEMVGRETLSTLIQFEEASIKQLEPLLEIVDQHGVLVEEFPMVTSDRRHIMALLTINRLKNPASNNLTYVAIIRDITEQKEMEDLLKLYTENLQQVIEEKSQELDRQHIQLIQSSKLATLGEMATGIAHELNQPLSGIRTRAQLVTKTIERGIINRGRIEQNQKEIIQLIDRISLIINHMRIFARQDQQKFSPFRLTQSIQGAISLLGEQLRIHAIALSQSSAKKLPLVLGEPLQIEQVILNLISNARDAMDLRAEQERLAGRDYHKELKLNTYATAREICLEVQDNGMGMSEEIRTKIFEPFFTTKPVGRGTGLGLSISYGILTNHNGRIEIESTEGVGTTFSLFLPIWDGSQEVAEIATREESSL